jgi:cytochrome d ubiquinol oxidase subunit II
VSDTPWLVLVVAAVLVAALNAYVLFGGADFGGGVWDLFAIGPRKDRQRALIEHAIGPIWEANHVWLILVVVLTFVCFPSAFSRLAITLHIPLSLLLVGIVLRGSAFTFRSYDSSHQSVQRRWGVIFAVASTLTPVVLGICVGALVSGAVGAATTLDFRARFVDPWATPFAFSMGIFALTLFAFLAAVYLTVEADEELLKEDFRRRALGAGVAVFLAAGSVLWLARDQATFLVRGVMFAPWALPLQVATACAALVAMWGLANRRYRVARIAAPLQVSMILWGWAYAQFPEIIPGALSLRDAAAPPITLKLVIVGVAVGMLVLIPSLSYLLRIFKGDGNSFDRLDQGTVPADARAARAARAARRP